jgi:hypothetical protein
MDKNLKKNKFDVDDYLFRENTANQLKPFLNI